MKRERWLSVAVLAFSLFAFLGFCLVFVPRLTNAHFGDVEFSGWSGPLGSRVLRGERPYIDFVLPIPPGSFAALALIEWVVGRATLLQEIWLNTAIHVVMVPLAYLVARPLTSRRNAVLVAICALFTLQHLNKQCAYDHTAQLAVWCAFAVAVRAFVSNDPLRRARLWLFAGVLSGFTFAFKQSTAMGIVFGWIGAFGYLSVVEVVSKNRPMAKLWLHDAAAWARGVGVGAMLVWGVLVATGSTLSDYFQAVFVDASAVKGGSGLLIRHLTTYLLSYPAYPGSLALVAGFVVIGLRIHRRHGTLSIGDEVTRRDEARKLGWGFAVFALLAVGGTFGAAAFALLRGFPAYPLEWVLVLDRLRQVPAFGLVFVAAIFATHFVRTAALESDGPPTLTEGPRRTGHVINALFLAAFATTLLHNTSAPEFRPFYDNNVIIPFAFLAFMVSLDRAGLGWLQAVVVLLLCGSILGNRYHTAMTAVMPVDPSTYWAGMRVSERGHAIDRVAERVRQLTRPHEEVLVIPEDLAMAQQIGRPRPDLLGAILFVDQYAPRLVAEDVARLAEDMPKVVVLHPRELTGWQRFFRIWSGSSGAERVMQHFLGDWLGNRYRLDSSHPTQFLWKPATLEIWVLDDGNRPVELASDEDAKPEETEDDDEQPEEADDPSDAGSDAPSDARVDGADAGAGDAR